MMSHKMSDVMPTSMSFLPDSSLPTFQLSPVGSSDWSKSFEISRQAAEEGSPTGSSGREVSFTSIPAGQAGRGSRVSRHDG